jgi:hypothetical protein
MLRLQEGFQAHRETLECDRERHVQVQAKSFQGASC